MGLVKNRVQMLREQWANANRTPSKRKKKISCLVDYSKKQEGAGNNAAKSSRNLLVDHHLLARKYDAYRKQKIVVGAMETAEDDGDGLVRFSLKRKNFREKGATAAERSNRRNFKVVYNAETGKHDVVNNSTGRAPPASRGKGSILRTNSFDEDILRCPSAAYADLVTRKSPTSKTPKRKGRKPSSTATDIVIPSGAYLMGSPGKETTPTRKALPMRSLSDQDGLRLLQRMHHEAAMEANIEHRTNNKIAVRKKKRDDDQRPALPKRALSRDMSLRAIQALLKEREAELQEIDSELQEREFRLGAINSALEKSKKRRKKNKKKQKIKKNRDEHPRPPQRSDGRNVGVKVKVKKQPRKRDAASPIISSHKNSSPLPPPSPEKISLSLHRKLACSPLLADSPSKKQQAPVYFSPEKVHEEKRILSDACTGPLVMAKEIYFDPVLSSPSNFREGSVQNNSDPATPKTPSNNEKRSSGFRSPATVNANHSLSTSPPATRNKIKPILRSSGPSPRNIDPVISPRRGNRISAMINKLGFQ